MGPVSARLGLELRSARFVYETPHRSTDSERGREFESLLVIVSQKPLAQRMGGDLRASPLAGISWDKRRHRRAPASQRCHNAALMTNFLRSVARVLCTRVPLSLCGRANLEDLRSGQEHTSICSNCQYCLRLCAVSPISQARQHEWCLCKPPGHREDDSRFLGLALHPRVLRRENSLKQLSSFAIAIFISSRSAVES
jgi:hypothetical protein